MEPRLEDNPDHRLLTQPPTQGEIDAYLAYVQPLRARREPDSPLQSIRQLADWYARQIRNGDRRVETRCEYARLLAQLGAVAIASQTAPEIGAELAALQAAIDLHDEAECFCVPRRIAGREFKYYTKQQLWSARHGRLVNLEVCPTCGHANAR